MSEDRDDPFDLGADHDPPVSREGRLAEHAVRQLQTPVASNAFRARLRAAFVTPVASAVAEAAAREAASSPAPRAGGRRARRWTIAGAIAAVLLAIVLLQLGGPAPDEWAVTAIGGSSAGSIRIDGRDRAIASLRGDGLTLSAGSRIELPESTTIELRSSGVLVLETAPGSWFSLPRSRRGSGGDAAPLVGRIEHGEVRYVTGPGFAGRTLLIESLEATVEVVGTTFSVIRDSTGTCVCVESGRVRIDAPGGKGGWEVPAGRRRQVFDDSRPSQESPLRPGEAMKLQMFRDRSLPELNRTAP
jgi:ferric-dicitrate binding protein FerR (iron transport regulator)